MLAMDQIHHIRKLYYEQGMTISEIARQTGRNWKTIEKYVDQTDFNAPELIPKPKTTRTKLEPYKALIDQWLKDDRKAPRKQRHTAKRVYQRLIEENVGFDGSYSLVAGYVKQRKKELHLGKGEGFIPFIHYPGEAQADFGTSDFFENGTRHTGKYFVIDYPYSNQGYLQLHYGENMECLLESMKAIFEHVGGVPSEIWFDNTSTIVNKVIQGGGREVTERFARFKEHYGFKAVFTNPYAGHEKGAVENKVGYGRRNLLVPMPHFVSLSQYNQQLLEKCDKDGEREHYRHENETITERFAEDKKAFRPLPEIPFDTASYLCTQTDKWGKIRLQGGKHIYSVSPGHVQQEVWVKLSSAFVTIMDQGQKTIVQHKRLYGDMQQESMEWLPYLSYIAKKPRSLKSSGIYAMMPKSMRVYLSACANSECGKILKILSELTERTGFESALETVNQAMIYQAKDGDSLKNLYRRLFTDVPLLPPLEYKSGIPELSPMPSGLSDYDALLKGGYGA